MAVPITEPTTSKEDDRHYRIFELENKLRCLLVSDSETDKAACSVDVKIGHHCDPDEIPGVAHFLEHMIFLGTDKYPDESSFEKFLQMHGGRTNAYTSEENTNYFFDVNHDSLQEAIPRFASFFSGPLFTQSATDREMKAIESEHSKNLQNDAWKIMQLGKSTSNPNHAFHKFGTGNIQTLKEDTQKKGIDVRNELITFYENNYSSNIMCLVVLGRESLDTLQKWVVDEFSAVPNRDKEVPKFSGVPFTPEYLQLRHRIVPVKDLRGLHMNFQLPEMKTRYKTKEYFYLSHLLGHEGPGSILSELKKRHLVDELAAGQNHSESGFSIFAVTLELTEDGLERIDECIQIVFQYLDILRGLSTEKWREIYEELRDVNAMNFRFKSRETPFNYVPQLATNLGKYEPEHVLTGPWLFYEFDEVAIKDLLQYLTPENMRYDVISKTFKGKTDKVEKWYGTEYSSEPFSRETVDKVWLKNDPNEKLHIPEKNEFIATDFTVFEPDADEEKIAGPVKLLSDDHMECWYKLDTQFKKPKAFVIVQIVSPEAYCSPRNYVLTSLYSHYLQHSLNEFAYTADICGLSYTLSSQNTGLQLTLQGYNQKMVVLFEKIVERMRNLEIEEERFNLFKETFSRQYKNFWQEQPYQHIVYNQSMSLENRKWHNTQYSQAIEKLTVEDLNKHSEVLLRNLFLQCLINGNMTKDDAHNLCKKLRDVLKFEPLFDGQEPDLRIVKLENAHTYIHSMNGSNPSDVNSAVCNVFQIGPYNLRQGSLLTLLAHIAQQPCYEQLRTKEQLGYIVWSGVQNMQNVLFYRIIVQSSGKTPEFLDGRIEAFLKQFRKTLDEMTLEQFAANRKAVIALILEKDRKLSQVTQRFWTEISSRNYMFDRAQQEADTIGTVELNDVIGFFDEYIILNAPKRRKFSSRSLGKQEDNKNAQTDQDGGTETSTDVPSSQPRYESSQIRFSEDSCMMTPLPAQTDDTDTSTVVHIKSFNDFKRKMTLYPDFFWSDRSRL